MRGHSKNTTWYHLTDEGKVQVVSRALTDKGRFPQAIATQVGVSVPTVTKYLHMLVRAGKAIAEPELHRAKTGSTPRTFRLAKPGEERPDFEPPIHTDPPTYVQDDSNGTRSNRFTRPGPGME